MSLSSTNPRLFMNPVMDRRLSMFVDSARTVTGRGTCKYCTNVTREGKQECVNHLSKRPYVANLLAEMQQQEKETASITKRGVNAVRLDGLHVSEITNELSLRGALTAERLSRLTNFPHPVIEACLAKLVAAGRVQLARNSRGNVVALLKARKSV